MSRGYEIKAYHIQSVLHNIKFWETKRIKLSELTKALKEYNDFWYQYGSVLNDDEKSICKIINEDDLYFSDYECVDGIVKRKDYKPFTYLFKTTGKIFIENDLRPEILEDKDYESFDINTTKGMIECSQFYADKGLLHGFVGNSCPTLYYSKEEETIIIGCPHDEDYNPILPNDSYKKLANICTDLWWYSICDVTRLPDYDYEVHELTPGTWQLEHYYGITKTGYHDDLPYAQLKLVSNN